VLILDEAGMASTRETARVMAHARRDRVKVIAIGDSGQLSSVQAGGWLGSLTKRLGSHELREVMRQRDPRERQLLSQVRRGAPADFITDKNKDGRIHLIAGDEHKAAEGERAAVAWWRERQAECPWGQAVLVVRDNDRRARLNCLARAQLVCEGRLGESVQIADREFAVGDRVVARRNDHLRAVDNGMRGTVIAVHQTEQQVVVRTDAGAQRVLERGYVAEHLQHAYALTAHTAQGASVEWAGVVGHPEDFTRNWSYTALSRARQPTELFLIDTPSERELDRHEVAPHQPAELGDERTPLERLAAAMRRRDDEDLALDRIDVRLPDDRPPSTGGTDQLHRRSVDELRNELAELHARIGTYPEHLADQLQAARTARAEAQRTAADGRRRVDELQWSPDGLLRRRTRDPAAVAVERERLTLAEHQATAAAEREHDLVARVPDRMQWDAERSRLRERATALEAEVALRRSEHVRAALQQPGTHLIAALGEPPEHPRAQRTWQQTAQRVEAYRFDHAITAANEPLGPQPPDSHAREQWRRAHHDLARSQRDLGQRTDRGRGHDV
jgi:hypothetical protein